MAHSSMQWQPTLTSAVHFPSCVLVSLCHPVLEHGLFESLRQFPCVLLKYMC